VAERRLDGGRREQLALAGTGVLSFEAGPDLRRASLASALAAKTAVVESRQAATARPVADPSVVRRLPYRPPTRVRPAPVGSTRDRLAALMGASGPNRSSAAHDVTPAEAAQLTVAHLVEWGYLDPPP
jgi:electron transfer flavoprotein beta subunit